MAPGRRQQRLQFLTVILLACVAGEACGRRLPASEILVSGRRLLQAPRVVASNGPELVAALLNPSATNIALTGALWDRPLH